MTQHKQGCEALGGYGHGVGPCTCGAAMTNPTYQCPNCGSTEVYSTHEQAFMVNSGDHYCHMVKAHDADAKAGCTECGWRGERREIKEQP